MTEQTTETRECSLFIDSPSQERIYYYGEKQVDKIELKKSTIRNIHIVLEEARNNLNLAEIGRIDHYDAIVLRTGTWEGDGATWREGTFLQIDYKKGVDDAGYHKLIRTEYVPVSRVCRMDITYKEPTA